MYGEAGRMKRMAVLNWPLTRRLNKCLRGDGGTGFIENIVFINKSARGA